MNEGVKILLARMETNPEEFVDRGKWASLLNNYKDFLDEEDRKVIADKINNLMQQKFTEDVMKELLAPEEDDDMGKWFSAQKIGTHSGGATLGAYANVSTAHATIQLQQAQNTQLHELLHQKALVEVNRKPTIKVRKPQHETLFGKLKNYLHTDT